MDARKICIKHLKTNVEGMEVALKAHLADPKDERLEQKVVQVQSLLLHNIGMALVYLLERDGPRPKEVQ